MHILDKIFAVKASNLDIACRGKLLSMLLTGIVVLIFGHFVGSAGHFFVSGKIAWKAAYSMAVLRICFITLGAIVFLFLLNRKGAVTFAGVGIVLSMCAVIVVADVPEQVVTGRSLFFFTLPVLMSSLVIRSWASFVAAALVSSIVFAMAIYFHLPTPHITIIGFWGVALVSWLSARNTEHVLKRLMETNAKLDERVEERTRALEMANKQLGEYNAKLKSSNAELQQFAYVVSHDLQEPLRTVTSYLQLLEQRYKEKLDQDARRFIDFAVDGAIRMRQLIVSLLEYSRVGTRGKEFAVTNMEEVLEKAMKNLGGGCS